MKLQDLFERREKVKKIIGDVYLTPATTRLRYEGVTVTGKFDCGGIKIRSLKGAPTEVGGGFNCDGTNIKSLEYAPVRVGGSFNCMSTNITSLHNVHKQIKYIGEALYLSDTVRSSVLGVMFIKGLLEIVFQHMSIEHTRVATIINKHLKGNRDIHACQEELLEAGLGEYAKL